MTIPNSQHPPERLTRREFLKATAAAISAGALIDSLANDAIATTDEWSPVIDGSVSSNRRLLTGWDYRRGNLGGPWEIWRKATDDTITWQPVELPHCFNAYDAVDPDTTYYQGPGWYRTRLIVENPFSNGRTLLHFEGAGQKTEVYVEQKKVRSHIGGYDEFVVDITGEAAEAIKKQDNKGTVPLAVLCDNSRDLEMIPSNLSDFNLYGGLYRYVNVVYAPAVSIERVHIESDVKRDGQASDPAAVEAVGGPAGNQRQQEQGNELDKADEAEAERGFLEPHGVAGDVVDLPADDDDHRQAADRPRQASEPEDAEFGDSKRFGKKAHGRLTRDARRQRQLTWRASFE